jgi:hypothetical protein
MANPIRDIDTQAPTIVDKYLTEQLVKRAEEKKTYDALYADCLNNRNLPYFREAGEKDEDVCKSAATKLTKEYLEDARKPVESEKPFSAKETEEQIVTLLKEATLPWNSGREQKAACEQVLTDWSQLDSSEREAVWNEIKLDQQDISPKDQLFSPLSSANKNFAKPLYDKNGVLDGLEVSSKFGARLDLKPNEIYRLSFLPFGSSQKIASRSPELP